MHFSLKPPGFDPYQKVKWSKVINRNDRTEQTPNLSYENTINIIGPKTLLKSNEQVETKWAMVIGNDYFLTQRIHNFIERSVY